MAQYVDGFVIPLKRKNLKAYTKMAQLGAKTWMKYGALAFYECAMDDFGKHGLGFKKMCKLKKDETAVFAFIIYKSKAHRNQVNKKVHKEFAQMGDPPAMPFDINKFAMVGSRVLVKAQKGARK